MCTSVSADRTRQHKTLHVTCSRGMHRCHAVSLSRRRRERSTCGPCSPRKSGPGPVGGGPDHPHRKRIHTCGRASHRRNELTHTAYTHAWGPIRQYAEHDCTYELRTQPHVRACAVVLEPAIRTRVCTVRGDLKGCRVTRVARPHPRGVPRTSRA
jgi:hypothetical protein